MAVVNAKEFPKVTDTVRFELRTTDGVGCTSEEFEKLSNPYKVDKITIYFIQRHFAEGSYKEHQHTITDQTKINAAIAAEELACSDPTEQNIANALKLREEATAAEIQRPYFFTKAEAVATFGNESYPAWLSTDTDNAFISKKTDEDDVEETGIFILDWNPVGMREGDYYICWTWTPTNGGDSYSNSFDFSLMADTKITTVMPTHATDPEKYEILQERYLPEIFKSLICDGDLTPETLQDFNNAVAKGFTFTEDMANQLLDLFDANVTPEPLLQLLSNFFNLKLKSNDPTLWRRQIKRAVPLFKRKGTYAALDEALDQAGIKLGKFTRLWQIVSDYTWVESFVVASDGQTQFTLSKVALPYDEDNFELHLRESGSDTYTSLDADYVNFSTVGGITTMIWVGATHDTPITLEEDDIVRVLYKVAEVPDETEQVLEDYIRTLPLIDVRDETSQTYPPKNWNAKALDEDDPLFNTLVPVNHPYDDTTVWGKVRTEFPYGENAYNMDEYDGSKRDSINPCDIDKNFVDPCTTCQSSSYTVDVEILNLSDDKIEETKQVLNEFTPFHSVLHTINFTGGVEEYVLPPVEEIEILPHIQHESTLLAGEARSLFNRTLPISESLGDVLAALSITEATDINRETLAESEQVYPTLPSLSDTGTGYNENKVLYSGDVRFDEIGLNPNTNILEILTGTNKGMYRMIFPYKNTVDVPDVPEPIEVNTSFSFRISHKILGESTDSELPFTATIAKDNLFKFSDSSKNFYNTGIKTDWDVTNDTSYTGDAWKILIGATSYTIHRINSDDSLILNDPSQTLVSATGISYSLLNDSDDEQATGTTGVLAVTTRALVTLTDAGLESVKNFLEIGDYMVYPLPGPPPSTTLPTQYEILDFADDDGTGVIDSFYIADYSDANVGGVSVEFWRRATEIEVGYLDYRGLILETAEDHKTNLGIDSDETDPTTFKGNYLFLIDSDYYSISGFDPSDNTRVILKGPKNNWGVASGTSVDYTIYKYTKQPVTINGWDFDSIDRTGNAIFDIDTETSLEVMSLAALMLNSAKTNQPMDVMTQKEHITFEIEWADKEEHGS